MRNFISILMEELKICDTHNDFFTELSKDEISKYLKQIKMSGVQKVCASYWSSKKDEECIKSVLLEKADVLNGFSDIALLHLEDLWWVKSETELMFLKRLKPFSCSLTWNGANNMAGGVGSDVGLSRWGERVLSELNEAGVVIDLAHLNRKSFWQVAKFLDAPLYCSHTGFYGVKRKERNLSDKQIDAIVESGGFVGLFFFSDCIQVGTKKVFDSQDVILNLKYFTSRWGFDNIGFGTDFFGVEKLPLEMSGYGDFAKLKTEMRKAAFSAEQIDKIFFQNFEEFLSRI